MNFVLGGRTNLLGKQLASESLRCVFFLSPEASPAVYLSPTNWLAGDEVTSSIAISHTPIRAHRTYVDGEEEKMLELRAACQQGSADRPSIGVESLPRHHKLLTYEMSLRNDLDGKFNAIFCKLLIGQNVFAEEQNKNKMILQRIHGI